MYGKRLRVDPASSTRLTVNGIMFNWTVHHTGQVVVQHASGHGCSLVLELATELRPDRLPFAIKLALDAGWEPQQDGPDHRLTFDASCGIGTLSDTGR